MLTLDNLTFFFFCKSDIKSYITCVNSPSCGVTLKKYFRPRSVKLGAVEAPFTYGIPALSATKLVVAVTAEKYAPNNA